MKHPIPVLLAAFVFSSVVNAQSALPLSVVSEFGTVQELRESCTIDGTTEVINANHGELRTLQENVKALKGASLGFYGKSYSASIYALTGNEFQKLPKLKIMGFSRFGFNFPLDKPESDARALYILPPSHTGSGKTAWRVQSWIASNGVTLVAYVNCKN